MKFSRVFFRLSAMTPVIFGMGLAPQMIAMAKCPCDIYDASGTPCVAAHSTVRALYSTYNGLLYQVRRTSDNVTKDIGVMTAGGFANAAAQDSFLSGKAGTISKIYDQSSKHNDLVKGPGGYFPTPDLEANATAAGIKVNGHSVYGIYTTGAFEPSAGTGYRNNITTGMVTGNGAEGIYMVCSGKHYNTWCCFDYGNAQTNTTDNGNASMECLYFGSSTQWGHGSGTGPWVMNDCENGIQAGVDTAAGSKSWAGNTTITANYVTGTLKSKNTNFWELRGGDANTGKLKTMYAGRQYAGWYPKKLEGAIVLGLGGDNSHTGEGTFFEGAIVSGFPTDTTEDSIQANIIAAGYGSSVTPTSWFGVNDAAAASLFKVNYNPSNGNAVISYALPTARRVSMNIFDQNGRRITTIDNGILPAGPHKTVWDAKRAAAGVYVCRVAVDEMEGWAGKVIVEK